MVAKGGLGQLAERAARDGRPGKATVAGIAQVAVRTTDYNGVRFRPTRELYL
jgi:hypothetical protein